MTAFLAQEYGFQVALTARPCPFCGCDSMELDDVGINTWVVSCPSCNTLGPCDAGQDVIEALRRWNTLPEASK